MKSNLLAAALEYAERGWPIFPVRTDKTPYTKHGVSDATTDPHKIEVWWGMWPKANIALNVGEANMMVLDLDPGWKMKEIESSVGELPATELHVDTPRGGRHLYFTIDDGEVVSASASKIAPNVDVRSFHSYVLLPPSATNDGSYTWTGEGRPAHRTDEMVRVANSAKERDPGYDTWIIEPDLEENIASCINWLQKTAKIAIGGRGGDQCAYETAAMCKSFGISQEMAFELMWEHWNPWNIPPWSADEVDHFSMKIENGYRYNTSPPGNVTPAYRVAKSKDTFERIVQVQEDVPGFEFRSGIFRVIDRTRMEFLPEPTWLIKKFLPNDAYAIMFGAPETYKTFIALDIALSIAVGITVNPTWPKQIMDCGPVCFVAGEGRASMLRRVRAWEEEHYHGTKVSNFYLLDPVPNVLTDPDPFLEALHKIAPDGMKLVVMDTVGQAMQGANENTQEHASRFTALTQLIRRETSGGTVLALHHTGKKNQGYSRGSSVFHADVDTELRVEKLPGRSVSLTMTKQKDAAKWGKAMGIKLQEVNLGNNATSLVAVPMTTEEADLASTRGRSTASEASAILDLVAIVVLRRLAANTSKVFSDRALAVAISADEEIDIGEDYLRKKYIPALRMDSKRPVSKCYDAGTNRWKHRKTG